MLADTLYRNRASLKLCKDLGIKICGPKLGRHPKHVDAEQRRQDTDAENCRGVIERRCAFMKGTLGLDLVNTRTAESLAVKIDQAIVLSNVLALLRVLCIPIFILAESEGQKYRINYKYIVETPQMAG